jgi:hypothetical protein
LTVAGRRLTTHAAAWVVVPLAITLLSWHALPLEPQPGLDHSWQAALHMALHYGIAFGRHLIFTYGPLGFLSVPTLWYSATGTIAVLYTVLLRLALASALFLGARATYGTLAGAIVALLVAGASGVALETVPFLVFCVWTIDRVAGPRRALALTAIGGAVAGVELLNKESTGIEIAVLAIVVALGARGRRRDHVIVTLAALILALLAGWAASGQDWGALPAYARNGARIVSGYAAAMGSEDLHLIWQYPAGLFAFVVGLLGAVRMTADGPTRRRWGILALWVTFCFFEYKEGFVRHDVGHGTVYFVALMGGFLALRWRREDRLLGLGLLAALFAFAIAAQEASSRSVVFELDRNASSAVSQLEQALSPSERAAITARGREAIERAFPIDRSTLSLLRGHTVHVAPYEAAVAWAYDLDWRPLPVFQSYSAYTTGLDREDAAALTSAQAPERILRDRAADIDDRVQAFDEGLTTRTILCRYRELRTTASWQVLALAPNRCGTPVPLGTVRASWYQKVPVPAPPNDHSFVFVRIGGVAVGGLESLMALLYKPFNRVVLLDGSRHTLVEGTAMDGLLLRAPGEIDFSAPFNLAPDSSSIAVGKVLGSSGGEKSLTFSFYAQSVSTNSRGERLRG